MATDFQGLVYAKLADVVRTAVVVPGLARRLVLYNGADRAPAVAIVLAANAKSGDLPALFLDIDSDDDTGPAGMPTFAECAGKPTQTLTTYRLKVAVDQSQLLPVTRILRAVRDALTAVVVTQGRNDLGIDGCDAELIRTRLASNRRTKTDDDAGGSLRRVAVLTIAVRITYIPGT